MKIFFKRKCKICSSEITGRSNKIFCSIKCKNYYHTNLRKVTLAATVQIDEILHRNRSVLLEIMGKKQSILKVNRSVLDAKKFNFRYHTHTYLNSNGKQYHYVYDFAWMEFSNDEVLIIRK